MRPTILLVNTSINDKLYVYPLGLDYIASVLAAEGADLTCLDLALGAEETQIERLGNSLSDKVFDIVAFNLRNLCDQSPTRVRYVPGLKKMIDHTRQVLASRREKTAIVVGGAGASLAPERMLESLGADAIVCGEGEAAFLKLLETVEQGVLPGKFIRENTNIRSLSYDRGSWGHIREYLKQGADGNLQTKRGCNQECVFCSYPVIEGVAIRLRDPVEAAREFLQLEAFGFKKIFIVDAVFNNPLSHAKEVLRQLRSAKTQAEWTGFFTPKLIDRELLGLVKETHGGRPLKITIESGSDAMLKSLGKGFLARDISVATRLCREEEVPFSFTVLLGGPGENEETVAETCALIAQERPAYVSASIGVYLYPRTRLAEANKGILWHDEEELFGNSIYPVDREVVKSQMQSSLAGSPFPVYIW